MSQELIQVIDQISKEKGISKEMVIEAVESALVSAAKRKYGAQRIAVQIDPKRGDINMFAYKKVVAEVVNPEEEITLEDAQAVFPEAQLEGEVPFQVEFVMGGQTRIRRKSPGSGESVSTALILLRALDQAKKGAK